MDITNIKKIKIIKELKYCSTEEEKLIYLIDLGKNLPINEEKIRQKYNLIYGCQSNVWIKIKKKKNYIYINGDSDTLIIKGILLLIIIFLNKKKKKLIKKIKIKNIFTKTNLVNLLSSSRAIGINFLIKEIKKKILN